MDLDSDGEITGLPLLYPSSASAVRRSPFGHEKRKAEGVFATPAPATPQAPKKATSTPPTLACSTRISKMRRWGSSKAARRRDGEKQMSTKMTTTPSHLRHRSEPWCGASPRKTPSSQP
ncbi:hypothetical protein NPX13_g5081 [Xylaria arbuscula]|uniref:Uncharacterized protein n=1 Tax=Xylaria arbuscula TaxID=114810 RepID=A0A9W8NF97_9PEZI|nr:hypothetical protein NPX13_g5081 [Xylaria arbuscula]